LLLVVTGEVTDRPQVKPSPARAGDVDTVHAGSLSYSLCAIQAGITVECEGIKKPGDDSTSSPGASDLDPFARRPDMEQLSLDDVEIWKPVVGWEGLYEVSSLGRVKSFCDHGRWKTGPEGRLLKISYNVDNGYAYVRLSRNGTSTPRTVHSLVLEAFVGPCPRAWSAATPTGTRLTRACRT